MKFSLLGKVACVFALGACSSTGGAELLTQADIDLFNLNYSIADAKPVALNVPTTGSATFAGRAGMDISRTDGGSGFQATVLGDIGMNVDFAADTVTGSFNNMVMGDNDGNTSAVGGSLAIDAAILATVAVFGDLEGALTMDIDGSVRNVTMDMAISGIFRGGSLAIPTDTISGTIGGTGSGDVMLDVDSGFFFVDQQ